MSSRASKHAELLRFTPGGCLIVDDGIVLDANPEAVETANVPLSDLVGIPFSRFLVPEAESAWVTLLGRAGPTPQSTMARLSRDLTPIELTARQLPDDLIAVGIRSMASEYYYSALAKAELTHDPLTGLSNRYHLLTQLQDRIATVPRAGIAIIGLWIDELPTLVSTQGERTVERVVKDVGTRIQGRLRSPDIMGRFDEAGFVTLLTSNAPIAQLTTIANRLRDEVAFPVEFDDDLVSFTASIAVASLGDRRPSVDQVLTKLDQIGRRVSAEGHRTEIVEF
ncbi:MAG: GGDEF domain-containing protein [Actinomycetia bacterium]|nr:GGDEF domain-containing protein [Actinomycetes bacterium]